MRQLDKCSFRLKKKKAKTVAGFTLGTMSRDKSCAFGQVYRNRYKIPITVMLLMHIIVFCLESQYEHVWSSAG